MGSDLTAILSTFSVRELRGLAKEHGVDLSGAKGREQIVVRLEESERVREAVKAPAFRVRPFLSTQSTSELVIIAEKLGVDLAGAQKKPDVLARIAGSPAADQLLATIQAEGEAPVAPAEPEDPTDAVLLRSRNIDIDFGLVEDILDQARMRFEERNFDRALDLSQEALLLAQGTLDAFEKAAWSYAIESSQHLITESGAAGRDVTEANALLRDAKVLYLTGNLGANRDLLVRLKGATKALYSDEVRRIRDSIYAVQEKIAQAAHVGGDVASAEGALLHAREAMERGMHTEALALVEDSEKKTAESLEVRTREIRDTIPATEKVIEDARAMGADVDEALRLLEKARVALDRREFVLAGELVERAERSALQSQHFQIQKAMNLRMRLLGKAQETLNQLIPIVDEAAAFGVDVQEPRRLLADAQSVLDQGDYVNGMTAARAAEEAIRRLEPKLVEERALRGIARPTSGRCPTCNSADVAFADDGWAKCRTCASNWRWRTAGKLWDRFRTILRE